jgi:hypothetical protein
MSPGCDEAAVSDAIVALYSIVEVAPNTSVRIGVRPGGLFRGYRVAIPDHVAPHFVVHDLLVEGRSQLPLSSRDLGLPAVLDPATGMPYAQFEIPATAWAARLAGLPIFQVSQARSRYAGEDVVLLVEISQSSRAEFGRALGMEICQPGQEISVIASCTGQQAAIFEMLILGRAGDAALCIGDRGSEGWS